MNGVKLIGRTCKLQLYFVNILEIWLLFWEKLSLKHNCCWSNVITMCDVKHTALGRSSSLQNDGKDAQDLHLLSLLALAQHVSSTLSQHWGLHLIGDHQGLLRRVDIQAARGHFAVVTMSTIVQASWWGSRVSLHINILMTLVWTTLYQWLHHRESQLRQRPSSTTRLCIKQLFSTSYHSRHHSKVQKNCTTPHSEIYSELWSSL